MNTRTRAESSEAVSVEPARTRAALAPGRRHADFSRREILTGGGKAFAGIALAAAVQAGARSDAIAISPDNARRSPYRVARQTEPGEHVQAVVSAHELATAAGAEILTAGGTAADAAIAVAASLSVVEPWFSSVLGGGTWALYYSAESGEVTSLDGVGPVGGKATRADFANRAAVSGMHQAVVPGAWDGWMLWLERYGRLGLGEVLAPAMRTAREGYPVSEEMAYWLGVEGEAISARPDSARTYVAQGTLPQAGATIRQPAMADTFDALVGAFEGEAGTSRAAAVQAARDYYYRGPLAEAIVAVSDREGGYLTREDFEEFAAEIVDPISIAYPGGITVFENPPNSQGIAMLLALNILKEYDFAAVDRYDANAVHLQIEALKLAFADRHWYVGDPDRIDIPIDELLSDEHAARQRARINMNRALRWPIAGGLAIPAPTHTTTFHVVDGEGNAAAVTTSLGAQFLVIGDTGIHINNRMQFLSVEAGNANELTPGYKVRHTSNPYLALRDGRPFILGGNTGVDTQPQAQTQQFLNVVAFGLGAQEAIDAPRFVSTAFPATSNPWTASNQLQMEAGFPEALLQELTSRGHNIDVGQGIFGVGNMLVVSRDGSDAEVGAESRSTTAAGQVLPASEK